MTARMLIIGLLFLLGLQLANCRVTGPTTLANSLSPSPATTVSLLPVDIGDDPDGDKRRYARVLKLCGGSTGEGLAAVDWRFFVAGGLCASISHGWTTPLDVIKTKMQQTPEKYSSGMLAAARAIVAAEGAGVLLTGLAPTVVGYGIEGAAKFGLYEAFKALLAPVEWLDKFSAKLLASVIAGAFAAVLLCPMEEARIKMVGDASWAKENLVSGMTRLILEGGVMSTFVGLPAMLLKQIPYTMGKQVSFDIIAEFFYSLSARQKRWTADELRWTISVLSAFCASIVACLASQPGDVLLTETYGGGHGGHGHDTNNNKASNKSVRSVGDIIRDVHAKHGPGGFYLGLQARLSHVASIITSQLVINDVIKTALGLPATGSH